MESGGNFEDYIRFLSCHLFGPVNHGQTWKGWGRRGEKGLIISDNQTQTWLIITINDTSIGDLPLIITISDTCKNQPKRLDFDNTINLSSLIVPLVQTTSHVSSELCTFRCLVGHVCQRCGPVSCKTVGTMVDVSEVMNVHTIICKINASRLTTYYSCA